MGRRYTIGLIYTINENWIAGTYYVENLLASLKALPRIEQPFVKLFCYSEKEYNEVVNKTKYENIKPVYITPIINFKGRLINYFSTFFFKKHWWIEDIDTEVDLIFPNPWIFQLRKIKKKVFWIPDFQEKHFPDFFSKDQIKSRMDGYAKLIKDKYPIVFSSEHAKNDFLELFPNSRNTLYVMRFAVTVPDLSSINESNLIDEYNLPKRYFACCNQFWAHKNHQVILSALKNLKERGYEFVVIFTGKSYDDRNPDYYPSLIEQVKRYNLENNVKFLGFIPRIDQLLIMKNSLAVIQPSLFEGWSTVVEDVKALNIPIIMSDIPVHREQLPDYELFFGANDFHQLANRMISALSDRNSFLPNIEQPNNVLRFANKFMEIVENIV